MPKPSRRCSGRSTCHPTTTRRICSSVVSTCEVGGLQDAIDALKISIWSSDTVSARLALAEAYEKAGMVNEARTELKLVKRDPSDAEARQRLDRLAAR